MHHFDVFHCDTRYAMPQVYNQPGQAKHTHVDQNMFIHSAMLLCRAEVDGCCHWDVSTYQSLYVGMAWMQYLNKSRITSPQIH